MSAWHTHPLGQTLIVTSGHGFVQNWGGPIREILVGVKMPAWARRAHLTGPSPRAPRILATGCVPSAITAILLVRSSVTTVPRRCT